MTAEEPIVRFMISPTIVSPETRAPDAVARASESGVRHLLVFRFAELVGIVSVSTLEDAPASVRVAERMRRAIAPIDASATTQEAATRLRIDDAGLLPVVAEGRIVGVVTRHELRVAGIAPLLLGERRCASCREFARVERWQDDVVFCRSCRERLREDDELGMGD